MPGPAGPEGPTGPAGPDGSDGWTYVKLDTYFNTTTTANSLTGLGFTPEANSHYVVEGRLFLQTSVTTTGARPGISWPTGMLQNIGWIMSPNNATAFASRFFNGSATANAAATGMAVINTDMFGLVDASFITGPTPAGAFDITLAAEIAGTVARLMANSFLRYRKI